MQLVAVEVQVQAERGARGEDFARVVRLEHALLEEDVDRLGRDLVRFAKFLRAGGWCKSDGTRTLSSGSCLVRISWV